VDEAFAREYCDQTYGIMLHPVSARTGEGVEKIFVQMARSLYFSLPWQGNLDGLGCHESALRLQGLPLDAHEHLSVLSLAHNELQRLPCAVARCVNLRELILSYNLLCSVPVGVLLLRRLTCLALQHNPLPLPTPVLEHGDVAVVARAAAAACRATVRLLLALRKLRRTMWDSLNRNVVLIVCRGVLSTRHDTAVWLQEGDQEWEEENDGEGFAAADPAETSATQCNVQ
jgi:hypothetical protein